MTDSFFDTQVKLVRVPDAKLSQGSASNAQIVPLPETSIALGFAIAEMLRDDPANEWRYHAVAEDKIFGFSELQDFAKTAEFAEWAANNQ
ncbi:hypothetical protein [Novosphingobium sp.]|uniref:hypothetical protein n=1 Tax=Novosphingobium sp. TaxID=1874826 RepID=UPI002FDECD73